PPVSPATAGSWHAINSHSIVFRPEGLGYGLGAKVSVGLPDGVRLVGGPTGANGAWTVPPGSTLRLQQLLAGLGYLPLDFGYSYVTVSTGSQSLNLWHDGHNVATTAVNTGIASRPTATGTYPVYEHIAVGTMSGTNPGGSHYNDPGIKWISYFNGGDALHA